jgi:hypothetical protein
LPGESHTPPIHIQHQKPHPPDHWLVILIFMLHCCSSIHKKV